MGGGNSSHPIPSQPHTMIVVIRSGSAELIQAPQDPGSAWDLADRLTADTGVLHWVGRA